MRAPANAARRQWSPVQAQAAEDRGRLEAEAAVGGRGGQNNGADLTPEQRRAVWQEQRAAAERNRRHAEEANRGGGLANFLGVPSEDAPQGKGASPGGHLEGRKAASPPSGGKDGGISEEQRRAVWEEQRAAADRNRRNAHVDDTALRAGDVPRRPSSKAVVAEDAYDR